MKSMMFTNNQRKMHGCHYGGRKTAKRDFIHGVMQTR